MGRRGAHAHPEAPAEVAGADPDDDLADDVTEAGYEGAGVALP